MLEEVLDLVISEGSTTLYSKKLQDFFEDSNPNGVELSSVDPDQTKTYNFGITFPSESGNEFQEKSVVFDLIVTADFEVPSQCDGIQFSGNPILGTSGNDNLEGTNGNDLIVGFEGNDNIEGGNGNDCLIGNQGNDAIEGGNGNDIVEGGEGFDRISGSNGNDKVEGGEGNDNIDGGNGNDQIQGNSGDDTLIGGNGNDDLSGGDGIDSARGDLGTDSCDAETETSCEL